MSDQHMRRRTSGTGEEDGRLGGHVGWGEGFEGVDVYVRWEIGGSGCWINHRTSLYLYWLACALLKTPASYGEHTFMASCTDQH